MMVFGDTWSGDEHGEEFWDWMDAQRAPSELRQVMLDYAEESSCFVEIGTGAGHFIEHLAKRGWEGVYDGYDFSSAALDVAQRRLNENRKVDGRLTQGDFMLQDVASADLVTACGVLQHQVEWMPMVKKCLEVAPRAVFGIGYTTDGPRSTVRHHAGHSDWFFSVPHTLKMLAKEGIPVVESRTIPNPLRTRRAGKTEWLLVLGE